MKIRQVGAEFFHAEIRDERTDMVKITVSFHNFVNMPKTGTAGHRARASLMNCAANRKVAGLIPDGVPGIFHWPFRHSLTNALVIPRSLTGISNICNCGYRCYFTCVCLYTSHVTKVILQYWEKCIKKIENYDLF